jgi:drug/metabolite transporter (DMT)-like permease
MALVTVACNIGFQLLTRKLATSEASTTTVFLTALIGAAVSAAALPWQTAWGGWPQALTPFQWLLFGGLAIFGAASQWFLIRFVTTGSSVVRTVGSKCSSPTTRSSGTSSRSRSSEKSATR